MKIAVACEGSKVSGHFGHCEQFMMFNVNEDKIESSEGVANPGHKPGFLPRFLNDQGINVIISGGMGGAAVGLFNENNIEVVVGAQGEANEMVNRYLKGELKSTGSICHEHSHSDSCGDHE